MTVSVVIGYGSIGQRHVKLLEELGCEVAVVSRRDIVHPKRFRSIADALSALPIDYVVIANETSAHIPTVEDLLSQQFRGRVLIEKPLGESRTFESSFDLVAVGYNLRFHPVLIALADEIAEQQLIAMQIYCGQFLPDWRPGTDYRQCYSSDTGRGGGVLRDLSHELDYLMWLAGPWLRVAALGGRSGALDVASDEYWALLFELERCPVATVQINYLDRPGRRQVIVVTNNHTYCADLQLSTLTRDREARIFPGDRDHTYRAQHRAMLSGDTSRLCTLAQGSRVMELIAAVERAAGKGIWVIA